MQDKRTEKLKQLIHSTTEDFVRGDLGIEIEFSFMLLRYPSPLYSYDFFFYLSDSSWLFPVLSVSWTQNRCMSSVQSKKTKSTYIDLDEALMAAGS